MIAHDIEFLRQMNSLLPDNPPPRLISEYVEGRRNLPTSTPFPGLWRNSRAPYLVEIMDNMSPYSSVQVQAIMKPRKVGLTTCAENVVGYWLDANPTEILYVTASDDLAFNWATMKLPPLIDSLGFRDKITASTESAKSRRSGDSTYRKEVIGGALDVTSARSLMARRALDKRVLIVDEVDGVPALTSTGEGNWVEVLIGHTISWGARKKIMLFSSPTTIEASNINAYYEDGDKRVFLVPCPVCGKLMELKMGNESSAYGLKAETKEGRLIQAYYLTECCHEAVFNNQKKDMYSSEPRSLKHPDRVSPLARWEPTKEISDRLRRSYGMNSLYSPLGMLSFTDLYKEKEKAEEKGGDGVRSFVNLYEGRPYKDQGYRPTLAAVLRLRGDYKSGTIPSGVIYLSVGTDVQKGNLRDEKNPPRLELEVLGHGLGYRTWSILYRRFEGDIMDPFSGAWETLNQFSLNGGFDFRRDDGVIFTPQIVFIDSGDAAEGRSEIVYRFCGRWQNTFPIKGFKMLTADKKKHEKGDVPGIGNFKKYRAAAIGSGGETVYEISTNHYKNIIYNNLNIPRLPSDPQQPQFCDFPRDYGEEYFAMLTGTEKRVDGSFHDVRPRVEALDCRVYALCAGDVWLDAQVDRIRREYRSAGYPQAQVEAVVNGRYVLERLATRIG
jgi:phage terminase large subunit GpA-like protein